MWARTHNAMRRPGRFSSIPIPPLAVALLVAAIALFFCERFRLAVFAGDMGVKYLQALTFQSGPLPLPYPAAEFDPSGEMFPFEPPVVFETAKGWVSIWLNPMVLFLIPLFDRLFGWAGYLAAPFLGGLLSIRALALVGRELRLPKPDLASSLVWICTPLLFYTLVLWEHTLAVGCGLMALGSLLHARRKGMIPTRSGFWLGAAALFRVEAALAAGFLCLAVWLRKRENHLTHFLFWGGCAAAPPLLWGWGVSFLVEAPATAQIAFPYLSPFSPWAGNEWLPHFVKMLQMLVEPIQDIGLQGLLLSAAILAASALGFLLPERSNGWRIGAMAALSIFGIAFLAASWATASPFHAGILASCPAIAAVPLLRLPPRVRGLVWAWVLGIVLLVAIAPNNGGLQRGCRYLLLPCVLGAFWVASEWVRSRGGVRVALGAVLAVGLLVQAVGLQTLWTHKAAKEKGFEAILREDADFLITNVWYFPQEAGRVYGRLPILWTRTAADLATVMRTIETLRPGPDRFIAILPSEASDVAEVEIPHWHGERIEDFGRLPVLSFERVALDKQRPPQGTGFKVQSSH